MKIITVVTFFACWLNGNAQEYLNIKYKGLLNVALFHKTFIKKKPLSLAEFRSSCQSAFAVIDEDTSKVPDLTEAEINLYRSLISNTNLIDTSEWKDAELEDCVLVSVGTKVTTQYAELKLKPTKRNDKRYYDKLVVDFNRLGSKWDGVYSFSRPVFDETGNYAIVTEKGIRNDFGCKLLKWNGVAWKEMINVSTRE